MTKEFDEWPEGAKKKLKIEVELLFTPEGRVHVESVTSNGLSIDGNAEVPAMRLSANSEFELFNDKESSFSIQLKAFRY